MRVLIAPDKFAGTLTAPEAAAAIAAGWARHAPGDELDLAPMADGGPGFVDVLHSALGGALHAATVRGPLAGEAVPATVLTTGSSSSAATAWVESAQACGRALTGGEGGELATSWGVGELISAAADSGASTVIVGLGGSGSNDGGAGLLGALGALADVPLDAGVPPLAELTRIDLAPARERLAGVRLIAASDVDNPLTGLFGATKTYGPQKGIAEERLPAVDQVLEGYAAVLGRTTALAPGAGAAGGIGYALLLLGAQRRSGFDLVAEATRLDDRIRAADLVITGEGAFDFSSRSGKVPYGIAQHATDGIRPCIALAGQVLVGSREMRALGMESAYSMADLVGTERSYGDPAGALAELAERVARTWSR